VLFAKSQVWIFCPPNTNLVFLYADCFLWSYH